MKSVIIDDEEDARIVLKKMLAKYCPEIELMASEASIEAGWKSIEKHKPDIVFLDVELKGESGFDLLRMIKNPAFDVIFTTAFDHYAIKAFKFNALDYLLKPIDIDELINSIHKVKLKRMEKPGIQTNDLSLVDSKLKKIGLPSPDGILIVNLDNIIRCEADSNYTCFYLKEGKTVLVSRTLGDYEELLEKFNFIRTHNSHLINLQHVMKYLKNEDIILMTDESKVSVSSRKRSEVVLRLNNIN